MQKSLIFFKSNVSLILIGLAVLIFSGCSKTESSVTVISPAPAVEGGSQADYANSALNVSGTAVADGISAITVTVQLRNSDNSVVQGFVPTYSLSPSVATAASACTASNSLGISTCAVKAYGSGVKAFSLTNAKTGLSQNLTFTPFTINFSGNSNVSTAVASRVTNAAAWPLTGVCDYSLGAIKIGGNGIDDILLNAPTYTTTCAANGTFSVSLNADCNSFPSPCLNGYASEVTAFQNGTYAVTRLYATVSPTIVTTAAQLQSALVPVPGTYVILGNDIDLSSIANWSSVNDSAGGGRISFFGDGRTLSNLRINGGATSRIGFFSQTAVATIIDNVKFTGAIVTSTGSQVGGVIGYANASHINNVSFSGTVNGTNQVGGLIGYQNNGFISPIKDCTSAGTITASGFKAGGLVGYGLDVSIVRGISTANVSGTTDVGGFIGSSNYAFGDNYIVDSAASGIITCTANSCISGGFMGTGQGSPGAPTVISTSYFRGSIMASGIGSCLTSPTVGTILSDLTVNASTYYQQGLTCQECIITNGTALTATQMRTSSNFAAWDFTLPQWTNQTEGVTYPLPRR